MSGAMTHRQAAEVRQWLATTFPDVAVHSCAFLAVGWDSEAWLVNDDLVFRLPRRPEVATRLAREVCLLPKLAPALPVPVPEPRYVARDPALGTVSGMGYRRLAGVSLTAAPHLLRVGVPLARDLAEFLSALHQIPPREACPCGVIITSWADWHARWRGFVAETERNLAGLLSTDESRRATRFLAGFLDRLVEPARIALIHHDLALEHLLVDPVGARLTGVIDWTDAALGDPALDFAGLARASSPALLEELLRSYTAPVDGGLLDRARWYALLGPFHELNFGVRIGAPARVAAGLVAARALLEEHAP